MRVLTAALISLVSFNGARAKDESPLNSGSGVEDAAQNIPSAYTSAADPADEKTKIDAASADIEDAKRSESPTATLESAAQMFSEPETEDRAVREIRFSPDAPMSFLQFSGGDLKDLRLSPIVSTGTALSKLRFDATSESDEPARVLVRGAGQDSAAINFEPGVQSYVDDVFLPFTTGSIFSLIDTEDIDVSRGPQPGAGGKNSIGGTLRIRTLRPQPQWGAGTSVSYGNLGTLRSTTTVNVPFNVGRLKERAFGRFSFATRGDDGFIRDIPSGKRSGDDSLLAGRAALRFLPTENSEINLTYDRSGQRMTLAQGQCRDVSPFATNRLLLDTAFSFNKRCGLSKVGESFDEVFANDPRDIDTDEQGISSVVDVEFGNWAVKSITGWRNLKLKIGQGDFDDTVANIVSANKTKNERDAISQELRLSGSLFDDRLRVTTGGLFFQDRGRVNGGFAKFGGARDLAALALGVQDGMPTSELGLSREDGLARLKALGADTSKLENRGRRVLGRTPDGKIAIGLGNITGVDVFNNLTAFSMAEGIPLVDGKPSLESLNRLFPVLGDTLTNPSASSVFSDESRTRNYAGYVNTSLDVTDRLTFGAGLRYTVETKDGSTTVGSRRLRAVPAAMADAAANQMAANQMGANQMAAGAMDGNQSAMMAVAMPQLNAGPNDMGTGMTDQDRGNALTQNPARRNMTDMAAQNMMTRLELELTTDRAKPVRFSEFTPSADVSYRLSDNVTLSGRYARGFTTGELNDLSQNKSEVLDTYQLGMSSRWFNDKLLVNLTGYYSMYDDIQVNVNVTDAFGQNVTRRLNAANGRIQGLDLDFQTSFRTRMGGFDFGGGLGLIDARYKEFRSNLELPLSRGKCKGGPGITDCPLDAIARVSEDVLLVDPNTLPDMKLPDDLNQIMGGEQSNGPTSLGLGTFADNADVLAAGGNVQRNVDRTNLKFQNTPSVSYNLFLRYQLDMQDRGLVNATTTYYQQNRTALNFFNTVEQGGFGVLDFSLSWSAPSGRFTVGAYMNNALNRRYLQSSSDSTEFDGAESVFFSKPRTYGIQIGYRFGSL